MLRIPPGADLVEMTKEMLDHFITEFNGDPHLKEALYKARDLSQELGILSMSPGQREAHQTLTSGVPHATGQENMGPSYEILGPQ